MLGTLMCPYVARISRGGSLDANPGANDSVRCLALQADGKILVGGLFTRLAGEARNHIARLTATGFTDFTFNPGADSSVNAIAIQADGRIIVGGSFSTLSNQPRARIGRIIPEGVVDSSFDPGANDTVRTLAVQSDARFSLEETLRSSAGNHKVTSAVSIPMECSTPRSMPVQVAQ